MNFIIYLSLLALKLSSHPKSRLSGFKLSPTNVCTVKSDKYLYRHCPLSLTPKNSKRLENVFLLMETHTSVWNWRGVCGTTADSVTDTVTLSLSHFLTEH